MKLMNIKINEYFHMISLWKSPIKLPVEATRWSYPWTRYLELAVRMHSTVDPLFWTRYFGPAVWTRYCTLCLLDPCMPRHIHNVTRVFTSQPLFVVKYDGF